MTQMSSKAITTMYNVMTPLSSDKNVFPDLAAMIGSNENKSNKLKDFIIAALHNEDTNMLLLLVKTLIYEGHEDLLVYVL